MVYGAHLRASDPVAWIHAPLCHAVPVVRSPRQTVVELLPHPHGEPLRRLEKLSPLFRKLWHNARPEGKKGRTPTFQIVSRPTRHIPAPSPPPPPPC
jgi:polynucleotide 5'-hydroxyl-kinase GRC3/NOL9